MVSSQTVILANCMILIFSTAGVEYTRHFCFH